MREAPPNVEAGVHPARAKLTSLKGKRKRNLGKKLRKRLKTTKSSPIREHEKEEKKAGPATAALNSKPGAKGGGPGDRGRSGGCQSTTPTTTSGGEYSD